MKSIEEILTDVAQMGAANVLRELGLSSGEISQRKASEVYGRYFIEEAVRNGKLKPSRRGNGKTGTIYYRVADILAVSASAKIKESFTTL